MRIIEMFNVVPQWINPAMTVKHFKQIKENPIELTDYYRYMNHDVCVELVRDYGGEMFDLTSMLTLGEPPIEGQTWEDFCKSLVMAATRAWVVNLVINPNKGESCLKSNLTRLH